MRLFGRMFLVAGVALGLATAAGAVPASADAPPPAAVMVTWYLGGGPANTFKAVVTDRQPGDVARVEAALASGKGLTPVGRLARGTEYNEGHDWHLYDVSIAPANQRQPDVCQIGLADLDDNAYDVLDQPGYYCPTAGVVDVEPLTAEQLAGLTLGSMPIAADTAPTPYQANHQSDPMIAVDQQHPSYAVTSLDDGVDEPACQDGTCEQVPGVGTAGLSLSVDGGHTWVRPTYQGLTARGCSGGCQARTGPIDTLPGYAAKGLTTGGGGAVAYGPVRGQSMSRLYYATSVTGRGFHGVAVSRLDGAEMAAAVAGARRAWQAPVKVPGAVRPTGRLDVWADNVANSRRAGTVYLCVPTARGVAVSRSTDAGSRWSPLREVPGPRQQADSCALRTDSHGEVYLYTGVRDGGQQRVVQAVSRDGGRSFGASREALAGALCGMSDPVTGGYSFDGDGGLPVTADMSVDIANGAPTGKGATNTIALTLCVTTGSRTGADDSGERALVALSTDGGASFGVAAQVGGEENRPYQPTVALSPGGKDLYLSYQQFEGVWQATSKAWRQANAVVYHADLTGTQLGAVTRVEYGPNEEMRNTTSGDLRTEWAGWGGGAAATQHWGLFAWTTAAVAQPCKAVEAYRDGLATAGGHGPMPSLSTCGDSFGNSDVWGGAWLRPGDEQNVSD